MHDALNSSEGTVLEADFYHADQLLPQSDEELVAKVSRMNVLFFSVIRGFAHRPAFFVV